MRYLEKEGKGYRQEEITGRQAAKGDSKGQDHPAFDYYASLHKVRLYIELNRKVVGKFGGNSMRWVVGLLSLTLLTATIVSGQEIPQKEILFAFFAKGIVVDQEFIAESFQTDFTLTNPGARPAQITIQFFSQDGAQLQIPVERDRVDVEENHIPVSNPFQLPGQASVTVSINALGRLTSGWVRIESTEPVAVLEGLYRLRILTGSVPIPVSTTLASVSIPPANRTTKFTLAVTEDRGMSSGISIVAPNANTAPVTGILALFDKSGVRIASKQVSVGARGQLLQLATELFPELAIIKNGTITGDFNGEVIVTSIRFHSLTHLLTLNLLSSSTLQ